jgi:F0F1-type ATP synthase assembly protein I
MGEPHTPDGLRGRDLVGLGGLVAGAVVTGMLLGLLVDKAAGTGTTWTLVGVGIGVVIGIAGFVVRVRNALKN